MPRPPSPSSSDRRWPARYPARNDRDRPAYRDYDGDYDYSDRERDRRERERDEYDAYTAAGARGRGGGRPPPLAPPSYSRIGAREREYMSPPPRRDRSWSREREREYERERDREYEWDRERERERMRDREFDRDAPPPLLSGGGRKRSPSPSPRSVRSRYSPPPPPPLLPLDDRDARSRYARAPPPGGGGGGRAAYDYAPTSSSSYDRPAARRMSSPHRGQGLHYASHTLPTPPSHSAMGSGNSALQLDEGKRGNAIVVGAGDKGEHEGRAEEVVLENGEYSEEEGMVTPPQLKKRKLEEADADAREDKERKTGSATPSLATVNTSEGPAAPTLLEEVRKPRLVVVSAPKRLVDSPPHQSRTAAAAAAVPSPAAPLPAEDAAQSEVEDAPGMQDTMKHPSSPRRVESKSETNTTSAGEPTVLPSTQQTSAPAPERDRSRSPIKISLPSISLGGGKKAGNAPTPTAAAGFAVDRPKRVASPDQKVISDSRNPVDGRYGVAGPSSTESNALSAVYSKDARAGSPSASYDASFSVRERRDRYDEPRYGSRHPPPPRGPARGRGRGRGGGGGYGGPPSYERYGRDMDRERAGAAGRRYSTSRSWSRSRSPVRGARMARSPRSRSRSSSPFRPRLRSVSRGPRERAPAAAAGARYRERSRTPARARSRSRTPRSLDSRSRSRTRTISRSPRSRSRSRSRSPPIPTAPSSFRRNLRPPTGPAAESSNNASHLSDRDRIAPSSSHPGLSNSISGSTAGSGPRGGYIPTGPSGGYSRGRGRGGPPIAPRAPRAERLGYATATGPPLTSTRPAVPPPLASASAVPGSGTTAQRSMVDTSQTPRDAYTSMTASVDGKVEPVRESLAPVASVETAEIAISQDTPASVTAPLPIVQSQPPVENTAELMADRESKIKIQFKRDADTSPVAPVSMAPPERPSSKPNAALVAPSARFSVSSSPIAPALSASPTTPLVEGKVYTASPKVGSSPLDTGAVTPGKQAQMDRRPDVRPTQSQVQPSDVTSSTPVRRPSHATLPPASNATPQPRSRASSSAVPPTPGVRTPHAQQPGPTSMLRHSTSYARPTLLWKEYSPPAELRIRDRPNVADVMDAINAVLPNIRPGGMENRDMTRIADDWERQLAKLQHERALITHAFQSLASGLRVKKFELGNALDEVWVAERKVEAAGMTMGTAIFSPRRE